MFTEKKAKEIISWCETIESFTASVKAEMRAFKGGVGTTLNKQAKNSSNIKAEKIKALRAKFHK